MGDIAEARGFTGSFISTVIYGIDIVMFFKCMNALLGRTGTIKWLLVAHTVMMFFVVTVAITTLLHTMHVSYIDDRGYSGPPFPGPIGYQLSANHKPVTLVPLVALFLNNWLADGLLLYRCCVIYDMNYWAIGFTCLIYLASLTSGIWFIYQNIRPPNFGTPVYFISHLLNILLTLMIVIRIAAHRRRIRNVVGGSSGVYDVVVTMLIESCALYTIPFLLYFGPLVARSSAMNFFFPVFVAAQVIAPFFIILRVANRTAFTTETAASRGNSSVRFNSQWGSTSDSHISAGVPSMTSVDSTGGTPGGLCVGPGNRRGTIEEVPADKGLCACSRISE